LKTKIETRIEAAFNNKRPSPDPNGDRTEEADIRGEGLTADDISNHELVKDVIENDDGSFHVYVSADSGVHISST
jgi:hypothetical protein